MTKIKPTPSSEIARKSLPFKTQPSNTVVVVGNPRVGELEVPLYGGLTNIEAIELQRFAREKKYEDLRQKFNDKTQEELEAMVKDELDTTDLAGFILNYTAEMATMLLRSRIRTDWTMADTELLPQALVNELAAVMQNEIEASSMDRTRAQEEDGEIPNAE